MDRIENVEAFHAQGGNNGPLLPIYHFNALAMSYLVNKGGTVVDLGSGSGQFLAYLSRCRPDLKIVGVELAEAMVETGQQLLHQQGLGDRIQIVYGDMTRFTEFVPAKVDLISTVFSLHHLPELESLLECMMQIRQLRSREQCSVWVFDHVRPRQLKTAKEFPEIFTPNAGAEFNQDSENSLVAAYTLKDLSILLDEHAGGGFAHRCSRFLRLYQVHWCRGRDSGHDAWTEPGLIRDWRDFNGLQSLFRGIPTRPE